MDQTQPAHHPSVKTYLLVFAGLGFLTALTVSLSYMHLERPVGILAAALIAATKCTLIATFFMHLKSERRGITFTIFVGLFLVFVLLGAIIPDIGIVQK